MNKMLMVSIALVSVITGCTTTQMSGRKPGSGQAEFSNDYIECQAVSKRIKNYENDSTIFMCMQGKGWQMERKQVPMPLF